MRQEKFHSGWSGLVSVVSRPGLGLVSVVSRFCFGVAWVMCPAWRGDVLVGCFGLVSVTSRWCDDASVMSRPCLSDASVMSQSRLSRVSVLCRSCLGLGLVLLG